MQKWKSYANFNTFQASVLQHPNGVLATSSISNDGNNIAEGALGPVFHSIRGSISTFEITRPTTQRFPNCTACCKNVLEEFAKSGFDLLLETAKDCKYLENLAGLTHLMSDMNFDDIIACSDDDDFW